MICNKCGNQVADNTNFCTSCGAPIERVQPVAQPTPEPVTAPVPEPVVAQPVQQVLEPVVVPAQKDNSKKKKRILVVSLLSLIVVGLAVVAILTLLGNGNGKRTIMIYIDGSNLESDGEIVTAELASINPNEIDTDNVNLLIYTGGTKEWHTDYISNKENAIFILTKDGFKKLETYSKLNMGDPKTLSSFLTYGYENYPASKYDLILYDHGGAIDGAIYDDFTGDNIKLEEFAIALKDSPFSSSNKFDSVVFRTCLNGTLEVASVFKDYAEYLAFSEEVSYGSSLSNVLSFINEVKPSDNGYDFGKRFVEQYKKQMSEIDFMGTSGVTYSVVDLSKIDDIISNLDKFVEGIDLSKSYSNISKVRGSLYQYGGSDTSFDTIDLYSFIDGIKNCSTVDSSSLLNSIENAILYNYTNMKNSNGVSIYFPFKGNKAFKERYLNVYNKLDFSDNYRSLIRSFYSTQSGAKSFGFNLAENESTIEDSGREVTLTLTEDEMNNYISSYYIVFERNQEHPNYYLPIYRSSNVEVGDNYIKTKIGNNLVSILNEEDGQRYLIPLMDDSKDGVEAYETPMAVLYDTSKSFGEKGFSYNVNAYFKIDGTNVQLSNAKITVNDDDRLTGMLLNPSDFDRIEIYRPIYKITDDNGNYTTEWESAPEITGFSNDINDIDLKTSSLQDGEYYVVFNIVDINNNIYSTNLIKVGE